MLEVAGLTKIYQSSDLRRRWGRERAVDEATITVGTGEFFTLLGPSGCGKTTLLRCVGGLEEPTAGSITVGDRILYSSERRVNIPANQRKLGMVFQSYAIWPHMSVYQNAAYPLTAGRQRLPKAEAKALVERVLNVMGLEELANRSATELSGGQQQRLALARALVQQPPLLLLDEPLSNLDAKLRQSMRTELQRLQQDLGLTVLYVTHDQAEALAMSTMIAVINEGCVEQIGAPREIYERPATRFVADFVGTPNFVSGRVVAIRGEDGSCEVETALGVLRGMSKGGVAVGAQVELLIRPEGISLVPETGDGDGRCRGKVRTAAYQGDCVDYEVEISGSTLHVRSKPDVAFGQDDGVVVTFAGTGWIVG
jgi:iron(III) transport system ATP-binding protein